MKACKHYNKETESCLGFKKGDQPGGWVEKLPGECVFKGVPPEEDRHNKWCLGYEPDEKGEEVIR